MKVVFVNTYGKDGGAGRAAFRLLNGLIRINTQGKMIAQSTSNVDPLIISPQNFTSRQMAKIKGRFDSKLIKLMYRKQRGLFSTNFLPDKIYDKFVKLNPEIIHLHWISSNFIRIESLKLFIKPIIWTLHDMWPFTGGCHYDFFCGKYESECGKCPTLMSQKELDLSRWVLNRKLQAWQDLDLIIITPSTWLGRCARKSHVFRNKKVFVIPNGIDLQIFRPYDKQKVRSELSLPQDNKIILFGALKSLKNARKGFKFIKPLIESISSLKPKNKIELLIFGASQSALPFQLSVKTRFLGHVNDDKALAKIYSAADVFIAPSIQDNLPNTVLEATACGTPSVSFNTGGVSDIIKHKRTGYLAQPFNISDLVKGVEWVLNANNHGNDFLRQCRKQVERKFNINIVAQEYSKLYEKIVGQR
ncbi:MAG: glycosyltransferase family 4 protein [Candidatus Hodarchaeota archaeon]